MHLLTLTDRVDLSPKNIVMPGEYIIDDLNAAHLLVIASRGTMTPLTAARPISAMERICKANFRVLLMRAGGYGDLVLLTPVLREIKRRFPECYLAVSTMAAYAPVLAGLPFVDEIVPYPLPRETAETFHSWVFYENAIERNPRAQEVHMTELFGEIAGITGIANLLPEYRVKPSELIWANEAYPRINGTRRVAIQVGASSMCRIYPREQLGVVVGTLAQNGWEVFLLGEKGEVKTPDRMPPNVRNLAEAGLTFRQSCAVMNAADCFIGSDSAILHVAGALGVPAVGLYGPFPWKLRTAHAPTTFSFQGEGKCAPCFHHVNAARRNQFPDFCPSKSKGICQVLGTIKPERIVAKVEQIGRQPSREAVDHAIQVR